MFYLINKHLSMCLINKHLFSYRIFLSVIYDLDFLALFNCLFIHWLAQ